MHDRYSDLESEQIRPNTLANEAGYSSATEKTIGELLGNLANGTPVVCPLATQKNRLRVRIEGGCEINL
jgi:hypothetical protein